MENRIYLEHLTPEGYDLNKPFDASFIDGRRVAEIRSVIRKFFISRSSVNTDYTASQLARDFSAYLGGDRKHEGAVRGDVLPGELIYAMVTEGYVSKRCHFNDAVFNLSAASVRAFLLEAHRDVDPRLRSGVMKTLEHLSSVEPFHREWYHLSKHGSGLKLTRVGGFDHYLTDDGRAATECPPAETAQEVPEVSENEEPAPEVPVFEGNGQEKPSDGRPEKWNSRRRKVGIILIAFSLSLLALAFCCVRADYRRTLQHYESTVSRYDAEGSAESVAGAMSDTCSLNGCEAMDGSAEETSVLTASDSVLTVSKEAAYPVSIDDYWSFGEDDDVYDVPQDGLPAYTLPALSDLPSRSRPYWVAEVVSFMRGLSDRDFTIALAALFTGLGLLFLLVLVFKRFRTKNYVNVKNGDEDARAAGAAGADGDDKFADLVRALMHENAIIYGDSGYLANVRTLIDSLHAGDGMQLLYFDPRDIRSSSPLPVLDGSCRGAAESYALARSLVDALRPAALTHMSGNEFFSTSTVHLMAACITWLGGWSSHTPLTFAHLVELSTRNGSDILKIIDRLPASHRMVSFLNTASGCRAMDQFAGQVSDLQMTAAHFYDIDILEAFRPVCLDECRRTVLLVNDEDRIALSIFRPLLDVISQGYTMPLHRAMVLPEHVDFTKAFVKRQYGRKTVFDGRYNGSMAPLGAYRISKDTMREQVKSDIDDLLPDALDKVDPYESDEKDKKDDKDFAEFELVFGDE